MAPFDYFKHILNGSLSDVGPNYICVLEKKYYSPVYAYVSGQWPI